MTARHLTASDIGSFVRVGELPMGAVFVHHSDIGSTCQIVARTLDGFILSHSSAQQTVMLRPTRLVRLRALPVAVAAPGCSVHGSAHDDTDERDCGGTPPPPVEAEALKALVLQYGLHSIEFGTDGVPWGSASSKVRAGLAGEIDDAIDALCERLRDTESRLVHAQACRTKRERACDAQTTENDRLETENAALIFRCADVAQEEAHKWEGSALSASEADYDASDDEKWARSNAEVARRIERKIRSLAPKAEAAIAAAMVAEVGP